MWSGFTSQVPRRRSGYRYDDEMKTYIALFRGINVGGKNVLPMNELVTVLESIGAQNVRTYIQSGNAVYQTQETNASLLANKISATIKERRGSEPQVLLLEPEK